MVRLAPERVLLIGDTQRQMQSALSQALPGASVTSVPTIFDGISELTANAFTAVLAAAEPIERRPEPAVRVLRELAHSSRLILFGHPTLEILSRKMLQFGCDDYVISPATPSELQHVFDHTAMRLVPAPTEHSPEPAAKAAEPPASPLKKLTTLAVADIFLESLLQTPHDAPGAALRIINSRIAPALELRFTLLTDVPMEVPAGRTAFSLSVRAANDEIGTLHLLTADSDEDPAIRHVLSHIAELFGKAYALQDRHNRLQKLAIADDLTGLYNARYFRHFLTRIIDRARATRFPVTLLLFDIDDFKKYNDQYGHGAGDEILKQTAQLMRRCCREHDLVARIGGDEFAVVFWDKEGPRHPLDPAKKAAGPSRPPQTPLQIFERFKRLAASSDFSGLGASGRGRLSVSGGLAVYPYDAQDVPGLIKAADDYLMFKAKKAGKNSVYLVEGAEGSKSASPKFD